MSIHQGSRPSTGGGIRTIPLDPGLCRNITIHGHCKWADKGCRFNHGEPKVSELTTGRLRPDTPTFTPVTTMPNSALSSSATSSIAAGAPVFVPRGTTSSRMSPLVVFGQLN